MTNGSPGASDAERNWFSQQFDEFLQWRRDVRDMHRKKHKEAADEYAGANSRYTLGEFVFYTLPFATAVAVAATVVASPRGCNYTVPGVSHALDKVNQYTGRALEGRLDDPAEAAALGDRYNINDWQFTVESQVELSPEARAVFGDIFELRHDAAKEANMTTTQIQAYRKEVARGIYTEAVKLEEAQLAEAGAYNVRSEKNLLVISKPMLDRIYLNEKASKTDAAPEE